MTAATVSSPGLRRFPGRVSNLGFGFLLLFALSSGCSALLDVEATQCEVDADCAALGRKFEGASCVEKVCVAADEGAAGGTGGGSSRFECQQPEPVQSDTITYSFTPKYATPPEETEPFTIKACERLDALCTSPVAEAIDLVAGELVELELPVGFAGYFQLENPLTLSALHFLGRPLLEDTRGWDLTVADEATVVGLGLATATDVDYGLGAVIVGVRDCEGVPLESAMLSSSAESVQFYIVNNFPTPQANATTSQGAGGFVNVPIGTIVLSAVHESGVELTPTSAVIRPISEGWISYVEIFP